MENNIEKFSSNDQDRKREELKSVVEDLVRRRNELINFKKRDSDTVFGILQEMVDFSKHIKESYKDYQKYVFFVVIAHGTPPDDYLDNYVGVDFSGDDSIEKFIEKLEKKYPEK